MNRIKPFLFLLVATLFASIGCVSSGIAPQTVDTIAAAVRPVSKNLVNAVLQKNPQYDGALLALAGAAEAALNGGNLDVQNIKAFVDAFAVKHEIDAQTKLVIASGIDDLVQLYRDTYGAQVATTTDPNVRRILSAFAAGVRDGVAFYRALQATASVSPPSPPGSDRAPRPSYGALGVPAIGAA
jgi:hypothetical protein